MAVFVPPPDHVTPLLKILPRLSILLAKPLQWPIRSEPVTFPLLPPRDSCELQQLWPPSCSHNTLSSCLWAFPFTAVYAWTALPSGVHTAHLPHPSSQDSSFLSWGGLPWPCFILELLYLTFLLSISAVFFYSTYHHLSFLFTFHLIYFVYCLSIFTQNIVSRAGILFLALFPEFRVVHSMEIKEYLSHAFKSGDMKEWTNTVEKVVD